jgi:hypothetical protein
MKITRTKTWSGLTLTERSKRNSFTSGEEPFYKGKEVMVSRWTDLMFSEDLLKLKKQEFLEGTFATGEMCA